MLLYQFWYTLLLFFFESQHKCWMSFFVFLCANICFDCVKTGINITKAVWIVYTFSENSAQTCFRRNVLKMKNMCFSAKHFLWHKNTSISALSVLVLHHAKRNFYWRIYISLRSWHSKLLYYFIVCMNTYPAGKISKNTHWRSVFLFIWHSKYHAVLSKIHSSRQLFQRFCRLGRARATLYNVETILGCEPTSIWWHRTLVLITVIRLDLSKIFL